MKKKVISILLSLTMVTGLLSGCGGGGSDTGSSSDSGSSTPSENVEDIQEAVDSAASAEDTGLTPEEQEAVDAGIIALDGSLPIIKDPAAFEEKYGKISMLFINSADRVVPVGELAMVQKWAEDTGVEFDWQSIPGEGAQEKINLMLASGEDLPDAFWNFGDGKSGNIVVQYADQDVFLPTEGLINEYMPNLKKILDDHPQYRAEITAPNGHTYGFPYIEEMYGLVLTGGPLLINKTWLDQVGKEVPTTVDEWVDCLKAFRDGGDLNGNGEADEIPMATWFGATDSFGSYNMFYRFTGTFGCADSYCGGNAYADHLRLIDGKVTFTAMDEAFRKTAEFFNMLYNENLIWNGSFEADESASYKTSLIKEDVARIGCFGTWTDQEITNLDVHDEYVPLPRLEGEAGKMGFANNYSELQDSSDTAITTTCKFPHVIARFVDYMVGDPAISIQSNWGAEGYNYKLDENGIWRMDYEDMDAKLKANNIHLAIFCSPHNPTGRVWERWELEKAMEVFEANQCVVISDEIWADITFQGHQHIPTQMTNEWARENTVAVYAPSKTFNLAGLIGSYHIIYNKALRDRVVAKAYNTHYNEMNVFSMHALLGAYSPEGEAWTEELLQVLEGNSRYAYEYVRDHFNGVSAAMPQGTYMIFLDCTEYCSRTGKSLDELIKAGWDVGVG